MNISVVIPTKDREVELLECIHSLTVQTVRPNEIIIVDDGCIADRNITEINDILTSKQIAFIYNKKDTPSSAASRNIGVQYATSDFILILDDDVVLDPNYVRTLSVTCSEHMGDASFGGASGVVVNERLQTRGERLFSRFFSLSSPYPWDVTAVGFQVWNNCIDEVSRVYYLNGGMCLFRKSVIREIPFRPLSPGRTALVDVDFFMRAKQAGYYFLIDPKAKLIHKHSPISRDTDFVIGKKEGYNRCIIYQDNARKNLRNLFRFIWSSIGWILRQLMIGKLKKVFGLLVGYGCYVKNLFRKAS